MPVLNTKDAIFYNGNSIDKVYYNGTQYFPPIVGDNLWRPTETDTSEFDLLIDFTDDTIATVSGADLTNVTPQVGTAMTVSGTPKYPVTRNSLNTVHFPLGQTDTINSTQDFAAGWSLYVVCELDTSDNAQSPISNAAGNSYVPLGLENSSSTNRIRVDNVNDSPTIDMQLNGVDASPMDDRGDVWSNMVLDKMCIIGVHNIASLTDFRISHLNSYGITGYIAAIYATPSRLSSVLEDKLEGFEAHRFGFNDDLPANHPHRIDPPQIIETIIPCEHWQLFMTVAGSWSGGALAEIEMYDTIGGADITTGGTPTAGAEAFGGTAAQAFDGNKTTSFWAGPSGAINNELAYLNYEYLTPVNVVEYEVTVRSASSKDQFASEWEIRKSHDGILYQTVATESDYVSHSSNESRKYTV